MAKFQIQSLSRHGYKRTALWSMILCTLIVIAAATLGRAAHNFKAALTEKPDVALYLLLPEEEITHSTLLKEGETQRDYLAETKNGPTLIQLKKGEDVWYVGFVERLHEGE